MSITLDASEQRFRGALMKVLRHEGVVFRSDGSVANSGYVFHPDDPGGETNYGITARVAREYGYTGAMRSIPFDVVKDIYRRRYWDKIAGDEIENVEIAEEMMDTAVNMGPERAVEFLQRTLNALNKKGTLYPDLKVDGIAGAQTIRALNACLQAASWNALCILRAIDSLQCVTYITLAEKNERYETFLPGWLRNRVGGKEG